MQLEQLDIFFKRIAHDPRIGISHISVFCAILQLSIAGGQGPALFRSEEVMRVSKISGLATYHRCIRELNDYGYLRYEPSFNHRKKNKAYFI